MKGKDTIKRKALEDITILYSLARHAFPITPAKAHHYMDMVYSISLRTKTPLPKDIKRSFCKQCRHLLVLGKNVRTRTKDHHVITTCLDCGSMHRMGYIREQKAKRAKKSTNA